MVKNKYGGNKAKSKSRKSFGRRSVPYSDLKKVDGQEYAHVLQVNGDSRYNLICLDKVKRLGKLRGSLRGAARVSAGDIVLISLRDYQDEKCDILAHFSKENVSRLISDNEISHSFAYTGTLNSNKVANTFDDECPDSAGEMETLTTKPSRPSLNIEDI